MSVYNGESYVGQSIESVLAQTFPNFELLIVDDASTDSTFDILDRYARTDSRIRILSNEVNIGLTRALNRAIKATVAPYIARQDADDYSLPQRLEIQKRYLDARPEVGLVGGGSRWIDAEGRTLREWLPLTDPAAIHRQSLAAVPFLHGTFMFRRSCLPDIEGGYDESIPVAQDCDLLFRLSDRWDLANVDQVVYVYRVHDNAVTAKRRGDQLGYLAASRKAAIARRLVYGWARVRGASRAAPVWVMQADRGWLAQRYLWWSAATRSISRKASLQFLLISILLDPFTADQNAYILGIFGRKLHLKSAENR